MNARSTFVALLVLALKSGTVFAEAPDFAREARMADEIVDAILDGDPEWLEADGREFLTIYTEADEPATAVIIMHGRGFHPDWADTVAPLRVGLVEHGYATLSMQMPVLDKEAKYYDYIPIFHHAFPRIEAGIRFLREQGYEKIVLLAHSCSVHMAMAWVRAQSERDIDGFVGLGMGATDYKQPMHQPLALDWLRVPVLDLYGADDYPAVIRLAPSRKALIEKAGHALSQQTVLPDADHYFTDRGDALVETVAGWLDRLD